MKAIIQFIDDLHKINDGDLSKRLKVGACVFGHFADCINSVVEDLSEAVQSLPPTHHLRKKYLLQLLKEDEKS